jgi:hypothetical protein
MQRARMEVAIMSSADWYCSGRHIRFEVCMAFPYMGRFQPKLIRSQPGPSPPRDTIDKSTRWSRRRKFPGVDKPQARVFVAEDRVLDPASWSSTYRGHLEGTSWAGRHPGRVCWQFRLRPRSSSSVGNLEGSNEAKEAGSQNPFVVAIVRRPSTYQPSAAQQDVENSQALGMQIIMIRYTPHDW